MFCVTEEHSPVNISNLYIEIENRKYIDKVEQKAKTGKP